MLVGLSNYNSYAYLQFLSRQKQQNQASSAAAPQTDTPTDAGQQGTAATSSANTGLSEGATATSGNTPVQFSPQTFQVLLGLQMTENQASGQPNGSTFTYSGTTTGPNGNTVSHSGTTTADGDTITHSGTTTGPNGNTVSHSGTTTEDGDTVTHSGTTTGQDGNTVSYSATTTG
jgi:hypothetical protein